MAQADELPPKKKSKLKWIILILVVLLIAGGGFVAFELGLLEKFTGSVQSAGGNVRTNTLSAANAPSNLNTATLPPFLVNLSDPLGRRYIKLELEVELIAPSVARELEAQNPRIRDSLIMLLSSKTYSELSAPEGKLLLKNEILDRINQVLGGPKVTQVFFNDLVIQ